MIVVYMFVCINICVFICTYTYVTHVQQRRCGEGGSETKRPGLCQDLEFKIEKIGWCKFLDNKGGDFQVVLPEKGKIHTCSRTWV